MRHTRWRSLAAAACFLLLPARGGRPQRAPLVTPLGQQILDYWAENATELAAEALPELVALIAESNASAACRGLPCEGATPRELVDLISWEFLNGMHLTHNGPLQEGGQDSDDSGLFSNLDSGWIQNPWQRVVEGKERFDSPDCGAAKLDLVEQRYFCYPPFNGSAAGSHPPGEHAPTWDEANGRLLYLSGNVWKKDIGATVFGETAYVVSPATRDRIVIAPLDTGKYALRPGAPRRLGAVLQDRSGNLTGFLHVILDHVRYYSGKEGFSVGQWLRRWYGPPGEPMPAAMADPYALIEMNIAGSAWLPEHLLFQVARHSVVWGTPYASLLRSQLQAKGRPLVWAEDETSGMVLDPTVGQVGDESVETGSTIVTPRMVARFEALWKGGLNFSGVYARVPPALRLHMPNYYARRACELAYACVDCNVMAINGDGRCVWWRWNATRDGPQPRQLRCCVGGRCQPCANGVPLPECAVACPAPAPPPPGGSTFPVVPFAACGGAALLCAAGGLWLRRRRGGPAEERGPLLPGPAPASPAGGRAGPRLRTPTPPQAPQASGSAESRGSGAGTPPPIYGDLRPGEWSVRVNAMRMDVRVYPDDGLSQPRRQSRDTCASSPPASPGAHRTAA